MSSRGIEICTQPTIIIEASTHDFAHSKRKTYDRMTVSNSFMDVNEDITFFIDHIDNYLKH